MSYAPLEKRAKPTKQVKALKAKRSNSAQATTTSLASSPPQQVAQNNGPKATEQTEKQQIPGSKAYIAARAVFVEKTKDNFVGHEQEFAQVLRGLDTINQVLGEEIAIKIFKKYSDRFTLKYATHLGGKAERAGAYAVTTLEGMLWVGEDETTLGAWLFESARESGIAPGRARDVFIAGIILHEFVHTGQQGYATNFANESPGEAYARAVERWFYVMAGMGDAPRVKVLDDQHAVPSRVRSPASSQGSENRAQYAATYAALSLLTDEATARVRRFLASFAGAPSFSQTKAGATPASQLSDEEIKVAIIDIVTKSRDSKEWTKTTEGFIEKIEEKFLEIFTKGEWGKRMSTDVHTDASNNKGFINYIKDHQKSGGLIK